MTNEGLQHGNTNLEIDELGHLLIPFYRNSVCKDELKQMKPNEKETIIINLNDSDQKGSHFVLCYKDGEKKYFVSSFGDLPPQEVIDYLGENIYTTDLQIQNFDETTCGLYSLLISYLLNENIPFEDIILDLYRV